MRPVTAEPALPAAMDCDLANAASYGKHFADVYDEWYPAGHEVGDVVAAIARLADGGTVLELGAGTGRLAIPLAGRVDAVWALDASRPMLERLRSKDRDTVEIIEADMATVVLPPDAPPFSLIFSAFNTFFLLTTEAAQRSCLSRCRQLLAPGGRLALEVYAPARAAPDHDRWHDETTVAGGRQLKRTYRRLSRDDSVLVGETAGRPWSLRPVRVEVLEMMAADAGFTLESRWRNWLGDHYFAASGSYVSVWR